MRDVQQALAELPDWIDYPDQPDLVTGVLADITASQPHTTRWRRRPAVAAAVAAAVGVLVVGVVPAAREQVASWLGIGGVTIETVAPSVTEPPITSPPQDTSAPSATEPAATQPPVTEPPITEPPGAVIESGLGSGLALGSESTLAEAGELTGFAPLLPSGLQPDRVFVDNGGRLWMLFVAGPGFPETTATSVGMIVTEFSSEDTPGIVKQIAPQNVEFVDVDGEIGLWVPGPHDLLVTEADGSSVEGRSVGNTLLWEQGGLTLRIESNLSLAEALALATSFE